MQLFTTCVEQLDLAAIQLHQNNSAYRRFALILIDNVVELLAHNHCKKVLQDNCYTRILPPRYPKAIRDDVLGRDFSKKMKFLHGLGLVSAIDLIFILKAHGYRNESYHTGIVHDDIIHAIGWHYHGIACELFVPLKPTESMSLIDPPSAVVQKHVASGGLPFSEDYLRKSAKSLLRARPSPEPNLAETLATSALKRIQTIEDTLAYVVKNHPDRFDEEKTIREVQFWSDVFENEPEGGYILPAMSTQWKERLLFMSTEWRPKIKKCPFNRWKERANCISTEENYANAIQNFENISRDLSYFEHVVSSACSRFDAYVDEQINIMREKRTCDPETSPTG